MRWNKEKRGRRMIRAAAAWILAAAMTLGPASISYARPDWPSDTGVQSESGIVMDMDSMAVIFAQNIHEQKAPASITKLLTALVVIENANLDDMVTFSHDAVYNVESGSGNKKNIEEGDQMTVRDCLYLLLLESSNQAANALAEHVAGSRDAFVEMMNQKIASLGCTESHFANPSGLNDDTQLTTAYDMALIGAAAYRNPTLLEIGSTLQYKLPPAQNTPNGATANMEHKMLLEDDPNYYPAAVAGKTGYTSIAGQTLVTYAQQDNRKLIAVTLKSTQATHYSDTRNLLDFGFSRFKNVNISENETSWVTGEEPLSSGGETYQPSELYIDTGAVITLPNEAVFADAEKSLVTDIPQDHPEQAVARIDYTYNERKIGSAWIYTTRQMSEEAANQEESPADQSQAESQEGMEESPQEGGGLKISSSAVIVGAVILLCAVLAGGGIFWYRKRQKEEQERRRILREKRRRRLAEIGCSEEEFERMMEERREGVKTDRNAANNR